MNHYCTLFDSHYLTRGLALYHSLAGTGERFTLYIYCFDELTHQVLSKLRLRNVVLIALSEFETDDLKKVKKERSAVEYCWTCTPHIIRHNLESFGLPMTTYVDADVYFYDKPGILVSELINSGAAVLITEHRYTPVYDQSKISGIYCVQFMTFRSDPSGIRILDWWQKRCLEWCFLRFEEGKFGDQKYLDDWPERFEGVHVLQHLGGGVAPWNVQQYKVRREGGRITVNDVAVVFYHYHNYSYFTNGVHDYGTYDLQDEVVNLLYKPYSSLLEQIERDIRSVEPGFERGRSRVTLQKVVKDLIRRWKGTYNARRCAGADQGSQRVIVNDDATRDR